MTAEKIFPRLIQPCEKSLDYEALHPVKIRVALFLTVLAIIGPM